ncbi:MAG: TonB-dependent receptor [Polyangiaceae bacterium]|nr:TonB-dependent receptor [Polyangiaceae bacterium]
MRPGDLLVRCSVAFGLLGSLASADEGDANPGKKKPTTVLVKAHHGDGTARSGRALSRVTRRDLDERLPRSAPDALRFEPGVFVQQTGHGQASPFLRGRTGQQTVLLFDGIRLNTSTYRQGPNQYFFTVDARSVRAIEAMRGGASTLYGSDALGGVLEALPLEPTFEEGRGVTVRPRTMLRYASADASFGQRVQADAQLSDRVQTVVGVGYQRVGKLRSGGAVLGADGQPALVPRLEDDGKTQLGTGYRELSGDGRVVYRLGPATRLVGATYVYRQYDAPRTDQCPPPGALRDVCLNVDEQFRTLGYLALQGDLGAFGPSSQVALSFQRQHERRTLRRPSRVSIRMNNVGRDSVNTYGLTAKLGTRPLPLGPGLEARLDYGADLYHDTVSSAAFEQFVDLGITRRQTRGQYLDGSSYTQGGAFARAEASLLDRRLLARVGGRVGGARAHAPEDTESGTRSVRQQHLLLASLAGVEVLAAPWLSVLFNLDRSVRAPNLDDLTARQQTGPGFQFENPDLQPETGTTTELGLRLDSDLLSAELWVFRSLLQDAITRVIRGTCPPRTSQCNSSWYVYQLINVDGLSELRGVEGALKARWRGLSLRASAALTRGDGPNPIDPGGERVPLSRVPPVNGTAELRYDPSRVFYVGAALRWALKQDRLAISDLSDARIPLGGTPGFAVFDARAGVRLRREMLASLVVENLADSPYRYHGSSINGPGRGVILQFEAGLLLHKDTTMRSWLSRSLLCASLSLLALTGCEEDDPVETTPQGQGGSSTAGSGGSSAGTGGTAAGSGGSSAGTGGSSAGAGGEAGAGAGGAAGSGAGTAGAGGSEAGAGGTAGAGGAVPVCEVSPDDYQPRVENSAKDTWPACIADSNTYTPVEPSISTLARIEAFEKIATLLGFGTDKVPSSLDFVDALSAYATPEGLESRVVRREDEHYPPAAKKCQDMNEAELAANPDRCVGPARMAPLLKAAFEGGAKGQDPRLNAARIEGGLLWFLYSSVYKEAVTSAAAPKDCDSSLAYYAGSIARDDAKGLARYVRSLEQDTHDRVFDGNLAVRCWRDLDKGAAGEVLEPELRARALAQLDKALLRGVALVVKAQLGQLSSPLADAAFEHVKILGPVLLREAKVRDAGKAVVLETQFGKASAAEIDVAATSTALEEIFPCP